MSIELGYNIIELHLHQPGHLGQSETCDGCEPGVRKSAILRQSRLQAESKEEIRLRNSKQLMSICGVKRNFTETKSSSTYRDRATERRVNVGSDNPYLSKSESVSIDTEISKDNIGRRMMEKSGWKSGQGLGKHKQGITEPIKESSVRTKVLA